MPSAPWFKDGLHFQCTACGDCCTGAPGYVWVDTAEVATLANHLGLSTAEFQSQYVRQIGAKQSLIEFENGDCVFFDNKTRKCKVYQARPQQCRTWPFWESNIRTPQAWKKTCDVCPGSGQGKLYTVQEALAQSAIVKL